MIKVWSLHVFVESGILIQAYVDVGYSWKNDETFSIKKKIFLLWAIVEQIFHKCKERKKIKNESYSLMSV